MPANRSAHLVIAAFWSVADPDDATTAASEAMKDIAIPGSGASVSIKKVDERLRHWLRMVQIEEAADWTPAAGRAPRSVDDLAADAGADHEGSA